MATASQANPVLTEDRPRPQKGLLILAILIHLLIGFYCLKFYQYHVTPDGIPQITIAQKYLAGDFLLAFNGYWGPLLSWLLVPFLALGIAPVPAFRILQVFVGALTLLGVYKLTFKFEMSALVRGVLLFSFVPMVFYFTFYATTADFLFTTVLICYFNVIFDSEYRNSKTAGVLCGLLGALAYFSKGFGLPFFLATFLFFNLLHLIQSENPGQRRQVLLNLGFGLLISGLMAGGWIYCLHSRYNRWTTGTVGAYHFAVNSPKISTRENLPQYQGLIESNEDPSLMKELPPWSPFQSREDFKWYLKLIDRHTRELLKYHHEYFPFTAATFIGFVALCLTGGFKIDLKSRRLFPLLAIFIYLGGYILVINRPTWRYFWTTGVLLILMSGEILTFLFRHDFFTPARKTIAIAIFVFFTLITPVVDGVHFAGRGKDLFEISEKIKGQIPPQSKVAANLKYQESGYLAFFLSCRNFGAPKPETPDDELLRDLKKFEIEFFFYWEEENGKPGFLANYKEITEGKVEGLKVFSLKEPLKAP